MDIGPGLFHLFGTESECILVLLLLLVLTFSSLEVRGIKLSLAKQVS